jgi:hypothetical protein
MAKLSDLFGRKGGAAEVDKLLARAANGNGNGGNHISVENLSDVGSRMGESKSAWRISIPHSSASAWNAPLSKAPWKLRARTIPARKVRSGP